MRGIANIGKVAALSLVVVAALAGCAGAGAPEETWTPAERAEMSKELADSFGITDPPDVDIIRETDSSWDRDRIINDCLREQGIPINADGGIPWEYNNANFDLAQYVCMMEYPPAKKYSKPWGKEQVKIQYIWTRDYVIPCLEYFGYPITGLPSESEFIDTWDTANVFFPFEQVRIRGDADTFNRVMSMLEEKCTQMAPGPVAWEGMSVDEWKKLHPYDETPTATPQ